ARAPVMDAVRDFAGQGGLVLGVCNGFQILCEAGLLPGVLMRNARLKFICKDVHLRVERSDTPFTRGYNAGQVIRVPVAHGEGNYEADEETVKRLEGEGRVLYRYCSPDGVVDEDSNINGAAESIGQPIVIENVAGAGGSTALTRSARADADGYTIAIGNAGTSAAAYTIYPKLPFTPESFVPIAVVAKTFGIVAIRKDFPAKNLQDFIAYAKKNPGKVNLGHAGVGSSNFLICKSFVQAAGIDVTLVGYRGAAPALTD